MMKSTLLILSTVFLLCACNSETDVYKQTFKDVLEVRNGTRTDMKIKFSKVEVSDILVKDSIEALQKLYETEKAKKIASNQQDVDLYKSRIAEYQKTADKDIVKRMLIADQEGLLKSAEKALESWRNWRPDYLDRYNGRDESEVLAKLVVMSFSYFNPMIRLTEEVTDAKLIFSTDGKTILSRIKE